jgi:hypothetical protein
LKALAGGCHDPAARWLLLQSLLQIRVHSRDSRLNLFAFICAHQRKSAAKQKPGRNRALIKS